MPKPLASIKYRSDEKLIVLPVSIGGQHTWFALDSGARHTVIDPRLTSALGLKQVARSTTTGAGKGAVGVGHVGPVTLKLSGMALPVADPWVIDLSGVPIAKDIRGLVGAELFERHIVRIDPVRRTLQVFDARDYPRPKGAVALPLIVENQRLFIDCVLDVKPGLSVKRRLRIDTGSGDSVNDPTVGQARETRKTVVGNGLGASYEATSGKLDAVHIGPFTIKQVWGPGGEPPSIGMEIFRRFTTTFDAPHGKLYLQPNAAFGEPVPAPPTG
ncbi:MAG TPA: retropepsin-like aspartic protease [Caulobacteraceae bacterium]|jgi:hypothetical protein